MADLYYNSAKFDELVAGLDGVIKEFEGHLEKFSTNYETIRANWSGTEFDKADQKLKEIKDSLTAMLSDQRKQKDYLNVKNADFANQVSGL